MTLNMINKFIWGIPALTLILGVGLNLSICTGFVQFRFFGKSFQKFLSDLRNPSGNSRSGYRALCTALAATVGTGNLAGVAGAIALGGPGAIFWMWICALIGMGTKFAEASLAVRFQKINKAGERIGGPMYIMENGLGSGWKWMASLYSFLGIVACLGVGNGTQVNTVVQCISCISDEIASGGRLQNLMIGVILAGLLTAILLGGAARIGQIAEGLIPVTAAVYVLLGLGIIVIRCEAVPGALYAVFRGAFTPGAVTGGVLGSAFTALRIGAARGVFTNEAGMGTASIAHGSSQVSHPAEQGLMGIMEVFLDTIVICTVTALVILCSGIRIPYGTSAGAELTVQAFSSVYGSWAGKLVSGALGLFAFATIIGWSLYGLRCTQYLFKTEKTGWFIILQAVTVLISVHLKTETVWLLSESVNGLMAIPNLTALALLQPELSHIVQDYSGSLAKYGDCVGSSDKKIISVRKNT